MANYERINWIIDVTPLSAANFNHMEEGIVEALDRVKYKHVVALVGKSQDEEFDVYLDFEIYNEQNIPYNEEELKNIFDSEFEVKGVVGKAAMFSQINFFGIQDNTFFVLFEDSEYGFNIGDYSVIDTVVKML